MYIFLSSGKGAPQAKNLNKIGDEGSYLTIIKLVLFSTTKNMSNIFKKDLKDEKKITTINSNAV